MANNIDSALPIRSLDDADELVLVKNVDWLNPSGTDNQQQIKEKAANTRNNGDYEAVGNTEPSSSANIVHDRAATAATPDHTAQNLRPTGVAYDDGVSTVVVSDIGLRDDSGKPYSNTNPLAVSLEESLGDEIHDYNESAAAIVKNGADNHEYTVTALKEFELQQWSCSGSGYMSGELQVETSVASGTFNSIDVLFNSTANPSPSREFKRAIKVAAGIKVRIIRTNLDNQAQGLHSFINGLES